MVKTATFARPWRSLVLLLAGLVSFLATPSAAVFINFDNCLSDSIINSTPLQLQFIPLFVDAVFNTSDPSHNLNVTIYGNVSGQATEGVYPPPTDASWSDPNDTFGKIVDVSPSGSCIQNGLREG